MRWDKASTSGDANGTVRDQERRGKRARETPDFFFTNFLPFRLPQESHLGLDLVNCPGPLGKTDVL